MNSFYHNKGNFSCNLVSPGLSEQAVPHSVFWLSNPSRPERLPVLSIVETIIDGSTSPARDGVPQHRDLGLPRIALLLGRKVASGPHPFFTAGDGTTSLEATENPNPLLLQCSPRFCGLTWVSIGSSRTHWFQIGAPPTPALSLLPSGGDGRELSPKPIRTDS